MLRSLRFRLPALFLAGIALAGLVTSLIALRLFQDYTRERDAERAAREAGGLAQLYAEPPSRALDEDKAAPDLRRREARGGDRRPALLRRRRRVFPRQDSGLTRLTPPQRRRRPAATTRSRTFEFTPPGEDRTYLAASQPLRLGGDTGARSARSSSRSRRPSCGSAG